MPEENKDNESFSIAVGLDGSDGSWKAFKEGLSQAKSRKAPLHLVSVQEEADASYSASEVLAASKTSRDRLEAIHEKALAEAKEQGVEVSCAIKVGHSHHVLIDYVKKHKISLLIVGDTGHSSIWGALLGTNAEKIVRSAPCSVLIVR